MNALRNEDTRRKVRKKYQKLVEETRTKRRELSKPSKGRELNHIIHKGNKLFEKVVHAREGSIDSKWFNETSEISLRQVNMITIGKHFDNDSFIESLKLRYKSDNQTDSDDIRIDWKKLGDETSKFFMRPPVITFMNGPIEMQAKVRKKGRRRVRDKTRGVRPEELENDSREGDARFYRKISKKLKNLKDNHTVGPEFVEFVDLCVDDTEGGFTRTIENIFYFSFLLKDNRAKMKLKGKRLLVDLMDKDEVQVQGGKKQHIFKLDLETYNKLCEYKRNRRRISRDAETESDSSDEEVSEEEEDTDGEADYEQNDDDDDDERPRKKTGKKRKRKESKTPRKRRKKK